MRLCAAVLLVCLVLQCGEALQCQMYPVSYTFVTADVQRVDEVGCSIASTNYTVCSTPSRLTDSQLGPQHNPTDNSSYYIFQGSTQDDARYYILFTFDQTVDIFNITLDYFVHNQGGLQPVVFAIGVGEDFELQNIQSVNLAGTVRLQISRPPSPSRGVHSASTQGGLIISSKLVLQINAGLLNSATSFCLSEVEFFNTRTPCPEPPSTSSTPATTGPTTDPPTTEPPTTATGPTTDPPVTTEPPTTATAEAIVTTARHPSATPPASNETATGRPHSTVIAAGVTAALLVAIVVLVVTTAVAVGVVAYRRRRRRRGGKRAGFEMEQNQCYATTTTHSKVTTHPSSGERVYDDIIIASNEENVYETIPA